MQRRIDPKTHNSDQFETWLQGLRRVAIDGMRKEEERRHWTLRERLFPLTHGRDITLMDIVYSESLWTAGTLAISSTAFFLATSDLVGAVAFVLILTFLMIPLLVLWTMVGLYFVTRGRMRPKS